MLRCRNDIALFIVSFLILATPVLAQNPGLKVVWPPEGHRIGPVDSTFIFGSVHPDAVLSINGQVITVHKHGGWLAYLPVEPGEFTFYLAAELDGRYEELTRTIRLPDLPEYTFDSLYINPLSVFPIFERWTVAGDEINLGFSGTPFCNAYCVVEPFGDTIAMQELPPVNYYGHGNIFGRDKREAAGDGPVIRGQYRGSYIIPSDTTCEIRLTYHLSLPSILQMYLRSMLDLESIPPEAPLFASLPAGAVVSATTTAPVLNMNQNDLPVGELTDSLTVIRTHAGKGYFCIHQPAGIRAEVTGKDGRWIRLALSDHQHGWVIDTAMTLLPPSETAPRSYVNRVQTIAGRTHTTVTVSTSYRHPFRIEEDLVENSITVYLYNVDSDVDWIRYDNRDKIIDNITWSQPEPGMMALNISLKQPYMWGFDGYYLGNEFRLDIIKSPVKKKLLSDLKIVIDPGHSPDPGAIGPTGLTEAEINLILAQRLAAYLRARGAEVIMTRDDDSPISLYDRPKIAVAEDADLFISVHNNALPDGTNPFVNNGVSVLYYHPHSLGVCQAVHRSMVKHLPLNDFGYYHGNLAVNRPTQYPAILVECAFMMIPEQEAMLKKESFQQKVATAIVEGLEKFLKSLPNR